MEVQWLRTFVDAAETLNFRKTSERLLMSQPSVTVHIRLLEENLGLSLFKRSHNRVSLTEEGRHFKEKAQKVLEQLDGSVEELHAFAQGYRKKWTLAISPLMAETVLPYVLRSFTEQHPEVELVIRVEESEAIEDLVETEEVSAGISALPSISRTIESLVVYEDPLLFILPRDAYDDETGPAISIEETLRKSILFTHHHPVFWEELLEKLRLQMPGIRTMKVTQAHIVKRFIQEGLGTSFLPKSIVRRELVEGRLMEAHFDLFPLPAVSTYFLTKQMGALEEDFVEHIQSVYFT
ncbi:LysR family transcriptional regulator [Planococcus donghaensis]|uniref:LysR family transcriptional regulator n=1 Tax=Planococcus donghaensis TaxID=414778 RepID=A0A1C7EMM9_9BACL|nr:LysR family transcriptional regulator [Planococcus donghaensis]ANU24625.1 LysR family transcriptional regulator [Planococcus donghaensis]ANU24911.1 LysR family transcriptional regulator [Planococcus donghaensis]